MGKGNRTRGAAKKPEAASSSGASKTLIKIGGWTVAVLFVLVLVFGILHTTGTLQRNIKAVTVGDMSVNALEFNVYYTDAMTSFINQNGQYLALYGVDFSAGFEAQPSIFGDGESTWGDYFRELALGNVSEALVLYQEGQAAGHQMSAEYAELLEDYMASFEDAATYYSTTVDGFISQNYGNGTKLADVRKVYEINYYASSYSNSVGESYTYTPADVEAYYQEHKTDYDVADYYSYSFAYETFTYTAPAEGEEAAEGKPKSEDEATQMTEDSKAQAKAQADAFLARIEAGEDFETVAKDYFDATEATHDHSEDEAHEFTSPFVAQGGLTGTDAVAEWAKDDSRAAGDKDVVENESGKAFVVLQFEDRYRREVPTATTRHILFSTETPAEDATDEEKAKIEQANLLAAENALKILGEWEGGERTEESFAALAKEHSADGNASSGGIYEHFEKGAMVTEFNDWVFDEARQYGDTGIVQTEFGYHVMYFVSFDNFSYYHNIETAMANAAYQEYYEAAEAKYPVSSNELGFVIAF